MEMKKNFFQKKRDKNQLPNGNTPETTVPILIEIVSASITHFDAKRKEGDEKILNTYCTVKDLNCGSGDLLEDFPSASPQPAKSPPTIQPKLIHKTKLIRKNNNPIWTVLTDSLCLVHISTSNVMELMEGKLEFELFHKDLNLVDKSLGSIKLRKQTLLEGDGSRIEYDLIQSKGTGRRRGLGQDHTNTPKEEELSPITSKCSQSSLRFLVFFKTYTGLEDIKLLSIFILKLVFCLYTTIFVLSTTQIKLQNIPAKNILTIYSI